MNVSEITRGGWTPEYVGALTPETILIREWVARIAERSLVDEVMVTPKPGLVDTHDTGAHEDMDVDTFVTSAEAIAPYIADMYLRGLQWERRVEELFSAIIPLGIRAERAMFRATAGVNTHKGAIFTMGILATAAGYSRSHGPERCAGNRTGRSDGKQQESRSVRSDGNRTESQPGRSAESLEEFHSGGRGSGLVNRIFAILEISGAMMRKPMEEAFERMRKKTPGTHGEKLFAMYGEKGIRGEAELGFPIIRDAALPCMCFYMKRYRPTGEILDDTIQNSININVLLKIMTRLSDTCVLSRGDFESLSWIQEKAAEVSFLGGALTDAGMRAIEAWNRECIERNVSPGGAADILSATLFLWRLESENAI